MQVLEVLGQENVKLSKVQVMEMINLLKAEMELEEEEKLKEKKEKEQQKQWGELQTPSPYPPTPPHPTPPSRSEWEEEREEWEKGIASSVGALLDLGGKRKRGKRQERPAQETSSGNGQVARLRGQQECKEHAELGATSLNSERCRLALLNIRVFGK